MTLRTLLPLAALALLASARPQPAAPRVTIDAGTLQGTVDSTGVLAFRGIPYAAPPVGDLRWRAPRRPARWQGVRLADRLGHNCMQHQPYGDIDPFAAGVSEDCLYLNVWTPALDGAPRPVMVWIHGGGFFAGFGGEERHDGARLARKGVVVVTVNYRLGAFGFLAHPALATNRHAGAGNYGILDQIAALQWVQRNAARFGGDPRRVTIFGESAGGMSVGSLVASPLAAGLFQRAILESGTGVGSGVQRRDSAEAVSRRVADTLGIAGDGARAAARLRAVLAGSVLAASLRVAGTAGRPIHWPVVDGRVLPRPVDSALASGRANLVPVIVGTTRDEGDEWQGAPARTFARLVTARGRPAWLYVFSRVGEDSVSRRRGAYHSAEITFVFGRPRPLQASAGSAPYDSTLAGAMSDYWVAFATSGDPNGAPSAGRWPRWPRYDRTAETTMELGSELAPRVAYRRAVYDSLDQIARARGALRP